MMFTSTLLALASAVVSVHAGVSGWTGPPGGGNGGGWSGHQSGWGQCEDGEESYSYLPWAGKGNKFWHLSGTPCPAKGVQNSTFEQLIDHNNPSLGTFSQFFFYDLTYWQGPGSPVVFFTPGEINVTGYTNYLVANRTTGVLAQEIGAATIVMEHRYWGFSSPFDNLTTENLQYLTLENAIADFVHFAKTADLPWATNGARSNADDVPWVMMGGSYSGALSAWTASVSPGTFWAYQASSAPVQAISNYWEYFVPVQEGMPQNCSADVERVIDYMDNILINGTAEEILNLKTMFGMESVEHNDDFMSALELGPFLWQSNQFFETGGFFQWCDYVENAVNITSAADLPGPEGVGLEKALAGYAQWWYDVAFPGSCEGYGYSDFQGTYNTACFNTYNASSPLYTDTSLSNQVDRQWIWFLCNQPFGYWQTGAPEDRPSIVSRLVTADWNIRQCALYFPEGPQGQTYGIAKGVTEADVNAYTGGWEIDATTRLIYVNGQYDPWREAGVSSDFRTGGPLNSTAQVPVLIVPGGFHTSDLVTKNGQVNPGCQKVINEEVAQLKTWVGEWYEQGQPGGGWGGHWRV